MAAVKIGTVHEVAADSGKTFVVNGHLIAVFYVDGAYYAIDDTCSHAEASLGAGEVDSDELTVECPLHGSAFSLESGKPRTLPAFEPVATYKVWADGDNLFVEYPA